MYLLDTNILSELIKKKSNAQLLARLELESPYNLYTSCVCIKELRFGSALRVDYEQFWQKITREIISKVNILSIGEKESLVAGDILAELRKTGQIIGLEDVLIAASALTRQYIVVTANIRHFSRVSGLRVENWLELD
jgi:tRNA(fMet)-specific endonuclease VapC